MNEEEPTFNITKDDDEISEEVIVNLIKTRGIEGVYEDNDIPQITKVEVNALIDHIKNHNYQVWCEEEEGIYGVKIYERYLNYINTYINGLPKNAHEVTIFWVQIISEPKFRAIYSIDYNVDREPG